MVRCPFPYMSSNVTNPDGPCDQLIADSGGNTYKAFMAGWLTGILILLVLTFIQFTRMLRIRGYSLHLFATSYVHHVYSLSLYVLISLLIRFSDPMNYAGRINYTFFRVLKDTTSWATFSVVLLTVCSWVKIMYQITGRSRHTIILAERIIVILTFLIQLFFGIIQPQVEKGYIVYAVQQFLLASYGLILIAIAWMHGLRVYCHLARPTSTSTKSASTPAQSGPNSSNVSPPITTTTAPPTTPNPSKSNTRSKHKESLQQKKSRVIILLKLITVLTVCVGAAAILQIVIAMQALKEKYHHIHNPEPYPTWTFGNLLNASGIPIISALCPICVLLFARKFGAEKRDPSSDDAKSGSDPRIPKSPAPPVDPRRISREAAAAKKWSMDMGKHHREISSPMAVHVELEMININNKTSSTLLSQVGRSSQSTACNEIRVEIPTPASTQPSTTTPIAPVASIAEHPFQTATTSIDDIALEMEVAKTNHATL